MSGWKNTDAQANNYPHYLDTNHPGNTDIYLVNASRMANATFGTGGANGETPLAHQGWVKINQGKGFVGALAVSNVVPTLRYTSGFLTFANGGASTAANAQIVVTGTGANNVTIVINNAGIGYNTAPTVTASGANNTGLVFTVTPGGRMGRVSAETLVALSTPTVTNANSGLPYFTGL